MGLGGRRWGAWRAHAHFVAFRATLKGDGEQKEAVVEELTLDCHLDSERGLLCKQDFLLGTKLHVVTAEVKERKLKSDWNKTTTFITEYPRSI